MKRKLVCSAVCGFQSIELPPPTCWHERTEYARTYAYFPLSFFSFLLFACLFLFVSPALIENQFFFSGHLLIPKKRRRRRRSSLLPLPSYSYSSLPLPLISSAPAAANHISCERHNHTSRKKEGLAPCCSPGMTNVPKRIVD